MKIKQFIKRAVSLVAACALLVSNTSVFTAFAEDSVPTIYAEKVDAMPGDTVDIHVSVKNNPGFVSMQIVATYDPNVLTLTGATLEAVGMNDNSAPVEEADGEYWIDFSNDTARKDNTADGSVYTLTFQVNKNAAVKSYPVALRFNYGLNYNEDMLSFVAQDTAINVICKHADLQTVAAKAETCTENGNISYWYCPTCDKCFKDAEAATEIKKAETIIAAHHTMKQVPAKDATCESEGNIAYYTCSVCGKLFKDANAVTETTADAVKLEKLSHKLTKTEAVPATCTKGGSNEYYTCSACGKIFKDADASTETSVEAEKTSKIPHTLTKTEYKAATCTEDGNTEYYTCSVCGKIFKDESGTQETSVEAEKLVATGHSLTKTEAKAATCTEDGNNEYYTCSACGKIFKDADGKTVTTVEAEKIAATGHTMTKIEAKSATCTEDGNKEYYTCSACGKAFKDADGKIVTTVEAEKIAATGHTMTKTEAKAATCTEDGNIAYWHCSVCNKYFSDENGTNETTLPDTVVKAHHTMTKTDAKEPTCTENGNNAYYTCSVCGKIFKDADGKTVTTVEAEKIAATGHTMTKTEAKAATCTEDGNIAYWHCSVCNKYFSDENGTNETTLPDTVVKAHHTMTKTEAKAATCTEEGNNAYYTCSVCGKIFKDEAGTQPTTVAAETLKKKAHTPVVDAAVAATCQKTGLTEGSHCSVCNEVLVAQKVVDKIPHTVVVDAAVEPTYSSTGLTEGKHCSVCNEVIEKQTVIPAKSESNVTVIGDESFAGSKKELADAVLSAEDIEDINSGKDITIRLNVALKSDATDAIKEQVNAKLKDYTIGTFYDIDISKSVDGGAPVAVTDTNAPVRIQLALADSLINTDTTVKREYKIVRFHYDSVTGQTVVDILDASYHAGYNKLAFNTDKFSVYAVVYKDTKKAPAPAVTPGSSSGNSGNASAEASSVTGKVCPICGYNNCKLGNDNRWHCGKCAHSWQEYGQAGSTPAANSAPKSPKTGLF